SVSTRGSRRAVATPCANPRPGVVRRTATVRRRSRRPLPPGPKTPGCELALPRRAVVEEQLPLRALHLERLTLALGPGHPADFLAQPDEGVRVPLRAGADADLPGARGQRRKHRVR